MRKIIGNGGLLQALSHYGYNPLALIIGLAGHPFGAIGEWIAGATARVGARKFDARRTVGGVNRLREDILRSAPSGGGPAPPLPSWLFSGQQVPAAVIRSLLGPVSPNLDDLAGAQ